jgi:hypothetical protein
MVTDTDGMNDGMDGYGYGTDGGVWPALLFFLGYQELGL